MTGPGWAEQYAYDPAGNITAATWPAPPDGAAAAGLARACRARASTPGR